MKKAFFSVLLLLAISYTKAQEVRFDSTALLILERMSSIITELQSCRLKIHAAYDEYAEGLGLLKRMEDADLIMKGPDKLCITLKGYKGERSFFFNGKTLSYYSFSNNRYAQIPFSGTILQLTDSIYQSFGIDFYAIDFFYPDFIDQLSRNSTSLAFLGIDILYEKECYHIAGAVNEFTYQIWISKDPMVLPVKVVFVYTSKPMNPQFTCEYEWELNQLYPDALFEFVQPPKAGRINQVLSK